MSGFGRLSRDEQILEVMAHWEVEVLGLRSYVRDLVRNGWRLTSEVDVRWMSYRFALRYQAAPDGCGLILVSAMVSMDVLENMRGPGFLPIERFLTDNHRVRTIQEVRTVQWDTSTTPELYEPVYHEMRAAEYFGFVKTTPEGIVVSQDNVQQLLDSIRTFQAPIIKDIRQREGSTWKGTEKVAAQIIAVAA